MEGFSILCITVFVLIISCIYVYRYWKGRQTMDIFVHFKNQDSRMINSVILIEKEKIKGVEYINFYTIIGDVFRYKTEDIRFYQCVE